MGMKRTVWMLALSTVIEAGCAASAASSSDLAEKRGRVEVRAHEAEAEPAYRAALAAASEGNSTRTLEVLEIALRAGACPTRVLAEQAFAVLHVETRFHELIRVHARPSFTVLVTSDEPGSPMVVSGSVRDTAGIPIANALLLVFHADLKGEYTPTKPMDEPHSRIFGYLRTDENGRFEFRTVRPGGYRNAVPLDGKDRLIPEHIHFEVSADGFEPTRFQMVFDDDPRIDDHWRKIWAPSVKAPIVKVSRDDTGVQICRHDVTLHRP
jgi:protocatechuate 3,4-dioxygenase beta subunit